MRFSRKRKPIIFGGPSLLGLKLDDEMFEIKPPVRAGDLNSFMTGNETVLIVDGLFGSKMSISVVECLDFLNKGGHLLGCSSMGALRAADCYNKGMIGLGGVFLGFLSGYYHSDADVAVRYREDNYQEISISLVHIDFILRHLIGIGEMTTVPARQCFNKIKSVNWYERDFFTVIDLIQPYCLNLSKLELDVLFKDDYLHPKKNDARQAINGLASFYLSRRDYI